MELQTKQQNRYRASASHILFVTMLMICVLIPFSLAASASADTEKVKKDIRIVIDISGSMKNTDPDNLRQPAVKLFSSLLTNDVYSGVWTFGKFVNMLVPHGIADKKWKSVALQESSNISSLGLFTNIEEAMQKATWDWGKADPGVERNLILLSDGMVDISDKPLENDKSRERILDRILKRLIAANVKIHTIALSDFSDRSLMLQLSTSTGGIHETIKTTSDLDKVFLRILDTSSPREEIPLINNKVKVDDSIKEITFLVFREKDGKMTKIISPTGNVLNKEQHDSKTVWHTENRYDLITIESPEPGTWKIDADIIPDNRVMVVTDLKFITARLPDIALVNKEIPIYTHLESDNKTITQRDFLHFVKINAKYRSDTSTENGSIKLKDNGIGLDKDKNDGVYSGSINTFNNAGKYTYEFIANGTTFKRQRTQLINVVKHPISYDIILKDDSHIEISIVPFQSLIDINSVKLSINHISPNKETRKFQLEKTSPAEWKRSISLNDEYGKHSFTIQIFAIGKNNNTYEENIKLEDIHIENNKNDSEADKDNKADKEMEQEVTNDNNAENEGIVTIIASVFGFNLLLAAISFLIYRYRNKIMGLLSPPLFEDPSHG